MKHTFSSVYRSKMKRTLRTISRYMALFTTILANHLFLTKRSKYLRFIFDNYETYSNCTIIYDYHKNAAETTRACDHSNLIWKTNRQLPNMVEQNIPILANVGRSFDKQLPRLSAVLLSFQRHIVIVVHHLRFDKLG